MSGIVILENAYMHEGFGLCLDSNRRRMADGPAARFVVLHPVTAAKMRREVALPSPTGAELARWLDDGGRA